MRQSLRRLTTAAVVMPGVALLALTGCKSGGQATVHPVPPTGSVPAASGPTSVSPTPSGGSTAAARTHLTITVQASPKAKPRTWTLACDPVGGDLPGARQACGTLATAAAAGTDPFAPTPKDRMCTQIYGGPQVATVKGTWNGHPVDATFNRKNGCEIKRWGDLAPLFGPLPSPH